MNKEETKTKKIIYNLHKWIALKKDMLYYCYESGDKFTTKGKKK